MSVNPRTDVLIVGAGPVGLLTAIFLGREGLRVTVVERWPERYPMPRACTIDHEALRILQAAGIMREHADLFEPSRGERGGYQIRNGEGELLQAINWNRTAESGWANTNGFYQPDLEEVLESTARALPAVEILRGWSANGLTQSPRGVALSVTSSAGDSTRTLDAGWLVAADGANSTVRTMVGIESIESDFEADWLVVDYRPVVDKQWDAFVTQYCDPAQPATAVNSGPGRRRFEFMRRPGVSVAELNRPETAWKLMEPWDVTPRNAVLERQAVYTFRGRWAAEWRRGRVFLAGDAAHLMPPFLGQGLCAGLRDARSLSWRLAMIASGAAGETVLDSYGPERSGHVSEIVHEAIAIGKVVCEIDAVRASERDERMRAALADPAAATVEPPSPRLGMPSLTAPGDELAGRLSVQARVDADGARGLFDDIVGAGWQLIGHGVDPLEQVESELGDWFAAVGGVSVRLDAGDAGGGIRDLDGTYRDWFTTLDRTVVLVRPDFYLYGAGAPRDVPWLLRGLRDALTAVPAPQPEGALS